MSFFFLAILLIAVVGSGSMVAIIAYLLNRISKIESGGSGSAKLLAEIEGLREQLDSTVSTLVSLEERVDFTEKLLGDGSRDDDT